MCMVPSVGCPLTAEQGLAVWPHLHSQPHPASSSSLIFRPHTWDWRSRSLLSGGRHGPQATQAGAYAFL